jgi:hypothetical protein
MKSILFLCIFLTFNDISAQTENKKLVNRKAIYQLYDLQLRICRKGPSRKGNIATLTLYENPDKSKVAVESKPVNCKDRYDRYTEVNNSLDDESGVHPFLYISSKEYRDSFFRVYYKPLKKYFWLHEDDVKVYTIEEVFDGMCIGPDLNLSLYDLPGGKKIMENLRSLESSERLQYLERTAHVTELKKVDGWIWVKIKIEINDSATGMQIGPDVEGWIMPFDKETGKPLYGYPYKEGC